MIFVWQINNDISGSPISGRVNISTATEVENSVRFLVGSNQILKNWYSQLFSLLFSNSMKPPLCVVDRWQIDLKTEEVLSLFLGQGSLVNTM